MRIEYIDRCKTARQRLRNLCADIDGISNLSSDGVVTTTYTVTITTLADEPSRWLYAEIAELVANHLNPKETA